MGCVWDVMLKLNVASAMTLISLKANVSCIKKMDFDIFLFVCELWYLITVLNVAIPSLLCILLNHLNIAHFIKFKQKQSDQIMSKLNMENIKSGPKADSNGSKLTVCQLKLR